MSLISALNIGGSALAAQQAALQVTGNNIANAGDPNYTRETATLTPSEDQEIQPGIFEGTGVDLTAISRQIDEALQSRLQSSQSDSQAASTTASWLGQIQSTFNALSGQDLSAQMTTFFNDWSNLANSPQDQGLRQVVLQDGATLAQQFQSTKSSLETLQDNSNQEIQSLAGNADQLATEIAQLNGQIVTAQGGTGGSANALLDQRDADIQQLSQLVDVQTVDQGNGVVNVYSGSEPLVINTESQGIAVKTTAANGAVTSSLVLKNGQGNLTTTSGQIGALIGVQTQIADAVGQVDNLAHNLISSVNQLHSSGQGLDGATTITATNTVNNTAVALNNASTGLQYSPTNGSFVVHVTDASTGLETSTLVPVQLNGGPGDTTLDSLTASLNAISGISATDKGGVLQINAADSNAQISFSQDSSGVLASLGVNTFFTGSNASNIGVNAAVQNDPSLLAAAQNGEQDDNQTALAISGLENQALSSLNGATLQGSYQNLINGLANSTSAAQTNATATQSVLNTLQSQRDSLSGVSVDEETINMLQQQRAYQAAAQLISVVNDMMTTLMGMIGTTAA